MAPPRPPLDKPNLAMGGLFVVSAVLQLNDPDPWGWAALYLLAGGASIAAAFVRRRPEIGRPVRTAAVAVTVASLVWAANLAPSALGGWTFRHLFETMRAETPAVELSREWLGLLWIALWMAIVALRLPSSPKESS